MKYNKKNRGIKGNTHLIGGGDVDSGRLERCEFKTCVCASALRSQRANERLRGKEEKGREQ